MESLPRKAQFPSTCLQDSRLVVREQELSQSTGHLLDHSGDDEELSPGRQGQEYIHHRGVKG